MTTQRQYHKNILCSSLSEDIDVAETSRVRQWVAADLAGGQRAVALYLWMRAAAPGLKGRNVKMTQLQDGTLNPRYRTDALRFLEREGFVTVTRNEETRIYVLNSVPELPDVPRSARRAHGVSVWGVNVLSGPSVDGELTRTELTEGQWEAVMDQLAGRNAELRLARLYAWLLTAPDIIQLDAFSHLSNRATRDRDLEELESACLVANVKQFNALVACPPATTHGKIDPKSAEQWRRACTRLARERLIERSDEVSQVRKLFSLLRTEASANGMASHSKETSDLAALLRSHRMDDVIPHLLVFACHTELFTELETVVRLHGVTLRTFAKNFSAIVTTAEQIRAQYLYGPRWWTHYIRSQDVLDAVRALLPEEPALVNVALPPSLEERREQEKQQRRAQEQERAKYRKKQLAESKEAPLGRSQKWRDRRRFAMP